MRWHEQWDEKSVALPAADKRKTYVNPKQLSGSLLPLLPPSLLQSNLPAAALIGVQPQPGEIVSKFKGPFGNNSAIHPPVTEIWLNLQIHKSSKTTADNIS